VKILVKVGITGNFDHLVPVNCHPRISLIIIHLRWSLPFGLGGGAEVPVFPFKYKYQLSKFQMQE
jgi:hypothetical protein